MKITIIGTGYVGLVTGTCFSETENEVICCDINETVIQRLNNNIIPIYEPGLEEIVVRNRQAKRLFFSSNVIESIKQSDLVFICVGTPPKQDGDVNLEYVWQVARDIAKAIEKHTVVITKSTVPVGTTERIREIIMEEQKVLNKEVPFDMAFNPEFLKEGAAVDDFMQPDRIIIGCESAEVYKVMSKLYEPFLQKGESVMRMDFRSAELSKYASNAMLATRISFMNEIANLCERIGADVSAVRKGIGSDPRIGKHFISPGAGYGGSCFPKDVLGLIHTGMHHGLVMDIIRNVDEVNRKQKHRLANKVIEHFGSLKGKVIAIWGLAFKPETDDMREAPSIDTINDLRNAGAIVHAHDPIANENAKKILGTYQISYFDDKYSCLKSADVLCILTEWMDYRSPDFKHIRAELVNPIIFDGRNLWSVEDVEQFGFKYYAIGYGSKK